MLFLHTWMMMMNMLGGGGILSGIQSPLVMGRVLKIGTFSFGKKRSRFHCNMELLIFGMEDVCLMALFGEHVRIQIVLASNSLLLVKISRSWFVWLEVHLLET